MVPPPGDWEDPVPVYFPIVKKGQSFDFYVTPRTPGTSAGVLEQAREWLKGGLAHLGAGGKTNSGYGVFSIGEDVAPALISTNHLRTWETTVKLVTPAFLAGPRQDGSDCDLRPATLRGLLRWWWRTLHAKHMSPQILRELESILWGNSEQGGAIAINLAACDNNPRPIPSPFKGMVSTQHGQRLAVNEIFTNRHRIVLDNNRSCGLAYLAYGMDEYFSQENRRHQRWCIVPKAGWTLSFITKNTCYRGTILGAETILAQAKAALCLLLRYGGVGSRSRRGFGSLALPSELIPWQHTKIRDIGIELRKFANIQNHNQAIATPAFDDLLLGEKLLNITDPWLALNHVGNAYMHFATSQKHQRTKMGLGLPRKIHGPNKTPIKGRQNPQTHKSPELLISLKASGANARHPAALFFSFDYTDNQNILVRISAMPDPWLISPGVQTQPERDTHRRYLLNVINHIFQHI
jgi:CRISPR-associated protein Cmr6